MSVTIHGIRNCDTMRKAGAWLDAQGIAYRLHDYRRDGLDPALLQAWIAALGWATLMNRAGTSFRKLPEAARTGLDAERAAALMLTEPAMIKRPVLTIGPRLTVGFQPTEWAKLI